MEDLNNICTPSPEYVREVTARYVGPRRKSPTIKEAAGAAQFISSILKDEAREHFVALYLNGAHTIVSYSIVSTGTANSTQAHPREIFQGAVLVGACALLVGHNHPSGQLFPSEEDKTITRRIKEASQLLGIPLLDHVIVGGEGFYSFGEHGIL